MVRKDKFDEVFASVVDVAREKQFEVLLKLHD